MADARQRRLAFAGSAAFAMIEPPALMIGRAARPARMFRFVPSPRLGEQARRRRIILEQRQMRRDVFRAPQPRPFRPGQIERANPQRTGDGAHEHHAIGRKPDRPARIERRLRARLVAFAQFLRGDSETAQDRPIISFASEPCSRLIQNRAISAAIGTQAAPRLSVRAIPGHIKTPPARANSVRAAIRALPKTRACMQESQSGEFEKPEVRRSAYSGSATKPALVSVIGLFAEASISGARPSAARASLMVKMPFDV